MFIILAGILCMGVAADETASGQITLVNPFDPSQTRPFTPDGSASVYMLVIDDSLEFEYMPLNDVSTADLRNCVSSDKTILYIVQDLKMNDQIYLNKEDVWIVGVNNGITVTSTAGSPFVVSAGSTTISSLTIDGSDFAGDKTGVRVDGGGTLTLKDVTIKNCANSGVKSSGTVNVSGQVNITGNTASGNESNLRSTSPVNVIDKLTGKIGIDMTDNSTGIAATGDILTTDAASVNVFSLDGQSGYKPTLNDKKELIFTKSDSTDPNPGQDNQKESIPGITLAGDRDADNKKITFTITSNIPECIGDYVPFTGTVDNPSTQSIPSEEERGTYMLVFHNTLDTKLELDENSISLMVNSKTVASDSGLYTITYDTTNKNIFELKVNLIDLYDKYFTLDDIKNPLPEIVLSFDALPVNGNLNESYTDTAYIEYGSSESNLTATKTASITIDPLYTVTVFKYDQENENEGLAGADFELVGNNKTYTGTTGDDGKIIFTGLNEGTYILSETEAPDGYAKSNENYTVVCNSNNGYAVTVKFANVKLPHTGGLGYKLPITIGIIGVIVGGAFIAVGRKKKNDK